jgi:hypothetical protein
VRMDTSGIAGQTRLAPVQLSLGVHPRKFSWSHDGAISHAAKAIDC